MKKMSLWKYILICFFSLFMLAMIMAFDNLIKNFPDDDGEWNEKLSKECIAMKVEKGYPEDFANEYCKDISWGCARGRVYEENCDPEVYCCFATIEEDKKWNYLGYDENGNKIEK